MTDIARLNFQPSHSEWAQKSLQKKICHHTHIERDTRDIEAEESGRKVSFFWNHCFEYSSLIKQKNIAQQLPRRGGHSNVMNSYAAIHSQVVNTRYQRFTNSHDVR